MNTKRNFVTALLLVAALMVAMPMQSASAHNDPAYSHDDSTGVSNTDWMASLSNNLPLSALSIPATHDSGAFTFGGDTTEVQSMTIWAQLDAGIRAFDIRIGNNKVSPCADPTLWVFHGGICQWHTFQGDEMDVFERFLAAHPSETILMRVQKAGIHDDYDFAARLAFELTPYASIMYKGGSTDPTLGALRGKILVFQDFGGDISAVSTTIPWSSLNIQDNYSLTTNWNLADKWWAIKAQFQNSNASRDDGKIYVNFLSGSGGVLPYFVASGHSSNQTGAPRLLTGWTRGPLGGTCENADRCIPEYPSVACLGSLCSVAFEGANIMGRDYLDASVQYRAGIVFADFPGADLIRAIIEVNPEKPQTGPTYTVNSTATTNDGTCGPHDCTLPEAIQAANNDGAASTIELALQATYIVTANHIITSPIIINAHGAVFDGQETSRLFWVGPTGALTIKQGYLKNGFVNAYHGGAIFNQGTLTLVASTLQSNKAYWGGAIYNEGTAKIVISTFNNNKAEYPNIAYGNGGSIYNASTGNLTLVNVTFAYNEGLGTPNGSADLYNLGTAVVKNTIFRRNDLGSKSHNWSCMGNAFAAGSTSNLESDYSCGSSARFGDPNFASWGYYGGLVPHVPAGRGAAMDAGNTAACQDPLIGGRDQRDFKRFYDANGDGVSACDIGAHEYNSVPGSNSAPAPDTTPPQVRLNLTSADPDGANDWYISPVTIKPQVRDASDVIDFRCALDPQAAPTSFDELPEETCSFLPDSQVGTDGPHTLYAAAMDEAGNKSNVISASFQIDATPPVLTCPQAGPFLLNSGDQPIGPAGVDASISGLDEAASSLSGVVTTAAVGPQVLPFTAFDLAGNSASQDCGYNVIYDFGGYYPPVEPAPALNLVEAGSAIPLKFSLVGDQGLDILAEGFPVTQQVACDTLEPMGDPSATKPAGNSGLSYDSLTGWYNYVWKTGKNLTNTCQALTIQLIDDTQHVAYFTFK